MSWDRDKEKKAGRAMSIGSCVFGIFFMIVWCSIAPSFMKLFGLAGLGLMIYRLYVMIRLGKEDESKSAQKETEPWNRPAIRETSEQEPADKRGKFCPYCGGGVQETFEFCPTCGRRLP